VQGGVQQQSVRHEAWSQHRIRQRTRVQEREQRLQRAQGARLHAHALARLVHLAEDVLWRGCVVVGERASQRESERGAARAARCCRRAPPWRLVTKPRLEAAPPSADDAGGGQPAPRSSAVSRHTAAPRTAMSSITLSLSSSSSSSGPITCRLVPATADSSPGATIFTPTAARTCGCVAACCVCVCCAFAVCVLLVCVCLCVWCLCIEWPATSAHAPACA
jgi:hypothetical protein